MRIAAQLTFPAPTFQTQLPDRNSVFLRHLAMNSPEGNSVAMNLPTTFDDTIVCPKCLGCLDSLRQHVQCNSCNTEYHRTDSGTLDLRLPEARSVEITIQIGPTDNKPKPIFGVMRPNAVPEVKFQSQDLPMHLTPEMASWIPKARSSGSLCLDLGCGDGEGRLQMDRVRLPTSQCPALGGCPCDAIPRQLVRFRDFSGRSRTHQTPARNASRDSQNSEARGPLSGERRLPGSFP
jgi:hypothetical protein